MKRTLFILVVLASGLISRPVWAAEQIDDFSVKMRINPDASVSVEERITYNFGDFERRGIVRTIPTVKEEFSWWSWEGKKIDIADIRVVDESGKVYPADVNQYYDTLEIKIGDPAKSVIGTKIYVIQYVVRGAIGYFFDHDELYWNAIGNEWEVPIAKSRAEVMLPGDFVSGQIKVACYAGISGDNNPCAESKVEVLEDGSSLGLYSQNNLSPGQGLTVVFGFPTGTVALVGEVEQAPTEISWYRALLILFLCFGFVPAIVFTILFRRWYKRGRDAKGREVVIAQFDSPDNLSPMQVGLLKDEKANNHDIGAELIYFASRGFIKITKLTDKLGKDDYELVKLKDLPPGAPSFQKTIFSGLFGKKTQVTLSDSENSFLYKANEELYTQMTSAGYFSQNPSKIRIKYLVLGWVIFGFSFVFGTLAGFLFLFFGLVVFLNIFISSIIIFAFASRMSAKTAKGARALEHARGLKMYLEVAEKDRIKFHEAPDKNPQEFSNWLPFAMIFGVEKEWADKFKDLETKDVQWYEGDTTSFSSSNLVSHLHNFKTSAYNNLAFSRSSGSGFSGGGSGFSGGHSGGGFGGGGGRSW